MNMYQIVFILLTIFNLAVSFYIGLNSSYYTFWQTLFLAMLFEVAVTLFVIIFIGLGAV